MEYIVGCRLMHARVAKTKAMEHLSQDVTPSDLSDDFQQMSVENDELYEPSLLESDDDNTSDSDVSSDDDQMEVQYDKEKH